MCSCNQGKNKTKKMSNDTALQMVGAWNSCSFKKTKIGSYVFIFLGKVLWGPTQEDSFPGGSSVKNSTATQVMCVQSLGQEAPLEKGNGNPLQYSCQENFIDRVGWWATVLGVTENQT